MDGDPAHRIGTYQNWKIADFAPDLPPGRIDRVYLHWSAHDYHSVFPAYHFCVALDDDGAIVVANTHDVTQNMRDVAAEPHLPYAAHTRGRNAYALGVSIMAMADATPANFGAFPITPPLVDALARVTSVLAKAYGVPIDADHVLSHAEAAVTDGYFGSGTDERWDIARLAPSDAPMLPQEAATVGDILRAKVRGV